MHVHQETLIWLNGVIGFSNNYSVIVEKNSIIIGFGDVDCKGYFDRLFTHKDYQGIGIVTLISDRIEKYTY